MKRGINLKHSVNQGFTLKRSANQGFTLIEIVLAITLITVFSFVGIRSYIGTTRRQAVDAAAEKIVQAFKTARANALAGRKANSPVCNGIDGIFGNRDDAVLNRWQVTVSSTNKTVEVEGFCGSGAGTKFTANNPETLFGSANFTISSNVNFSYLANGTTSAGTTITINDAGMAKARTITVSGKGDVQ